MKSSSSGKLLSIYRGEKGGFKERKLQSAFRPGKMKSSPLARTAIVVSNCLGYFALTIDRNYAL